MKCPTISNRTKNGYKLFAIEVKYRQTGAWTLYRTHRFQWMKSLRWDEIIAVRALYAGSVVVDGVASESNITYVKIK